MSQPAVPVSDFDRLEAELLQLIRERLLETPSTFNAGTNLYDAGLDSMAIMQLLVFLEQDYGVCVAESDLGRETFSTVHHLARLVQKRLHP